MSAQAAVVILQSINEFTVDSTSARDLINDATLTNVAQQGYAVLYSITGAYYSLKGWNNAVTQLNKSAFDETVAIRVINAFGIFAQDYIGFLIALINKHVSPRIAIAHDVLVSATSPLGPKGAQVAEQIANLQYELTNHQGWLAVLIPAHLVELTKLMNQVNDAFAKAAAKYPKLGAHASEAAVEVNKNVSEVSNLQVAKGYEPNMFQCAHKCDRVYPL
ncbi:uncharacterized protein SCHCODRAFT_02665837 [Schizophyllum commune H4-8]|uniref:Uncharacterized protein n=1 Tax=Schizophyllum commune (strain H4-8 / FGSC 9210) TaxID=578458 RepID=D8Q1N7_SCHCM|nr:uncharacterized protein SCHCODRAFT_02665837 [Schizophyllum commune H4-8]KAI5895502.1 hypothetical protein SCHCODRAFT_02665837 [Schizophyllum commune H4-8]